MSKYTPSNRCHPDTCKNDGICQQSWTSVKCDCTQTPFSGDLCDQLGTTYDFDGEGSCVYYEYPPHQRPSTSEDSLVLAFQTEKSNGVLFAVQCGVDADFLTVFLSGGYLQVRFSLGTQSHHVQLNENFIQDNRWHVLKLRRQAANLTLQLDKSLPVYYATKDGLATLNTQWRVSVGAAFNALHSALTTTQQLLYPSQLQLQQQQQQRRRRRRHSRVFDEFHGRIAGVNWNGLRVLDAYAHGWEKAFGTGRPQLIHMAASEASIDSGLFSRIEPSGDGFFAAGALDCLSSEARSDCLFDESTTPSTGFNVLFKA
uniref:Uncharacterized protein n=1 Tax=Panagrolaimus sp. PS1159 TaxID=55785 RepID=A0AC35G400_9BILA